MDPRLKNSLCRAIFRETRRIRNTTNLLFAGKSTFPGKSSSAVAARKKRAGAVPSDELPKKKGPRALSFQMPSVTELWGTGVYQEPELHRRSLRRLLPEEIGTYVAKMPNRTEMRRDVQTWLDSEGVEAFQILK